LELLAVLVQLELEPRHFIAIVSSTKSSSWEWVAAGWVGSGWLSWWRMSWFEDTVFDHCCQFISWACGRFLDVTVANDFECLWPDSTHCSDLSSDSIDVTVFDFLAWSKQDADRSMTSVGSSAAVCS
jgi:hypothetical protein